MNKKPTIQDIAQLAGVGPGTVSRVLNDHPNVSRKTREKVLAVINRMDYRPSFSARHMRTQRSHLIGFLNDEVATTPHAGDIIQGAQDIAWENGRFLMVVSTGGVIERAEAAVEALLERDVEGIIYASMYHREIVLPNNVDAVPIVLANCYDLDRKVPSVVPDEHGGGYNATKALLTKGHRRIGFINVYPIEPGIPASVGRLAGYRQALSDNGVQYDESLVQFGFGNAESGYSLALELMRLYEPPTALFCGNDRTAMGAYNALHELGLSVPGDVAVIGFDNQEIIATALRPPLTTMQLPHYDMGRWAIERVLIGSNAIGADDQHMLACPIVERQSI